MPSLEIPFRPVGRKEISHAGTAAGDSVSENFPGDREQLFDLPYGEATGPHVGMKPGAEQYFVGVDVSDSGDRLLMHEQGFQPA